MGSSYALKIKEIKDSNILKEIVFNENKRIVEYLYFITKINKYLIENFRKNSLIKEFTIKNVLTNKEVNIVIERVESGYFFQGLTYSIDVLPQLEQVLIVSKVLENSLAEKEKLQNDIYIILGNENSYFKSISDIEQEIIKSNAKFICYNIVTENIMFVDFEKYRDELKENFVLGMECEERNVNTIFQSAEVKKDSSGMKNLDGLFDIKEDIKPNIEIFEEREFQLSSMTNKYTNTIETELIEDKELVYEIDNEKQNNQMIEEIEDNEINKEIDLREEDNTNFDCRNSSNSENSTSLMETESNTTPLKQRHFKYNFKNAKIKYNKLLSIYQRLDSNFNLMNINKLNTLKEIIPKEAADADSSQLYIGNKNVILIKGFHLIKTSTSETNSLKITKLNENTLNVL
jgi:hypothetical protein